MHKLFTLYLLCGSVVLAYMSGWFLVSRLLKRNDIADVAWGIGFIVVALVALNTNTDPSILSYVSALLTTIWGLRLATHIAARLRNKPEDFRYAAWREQWGKWFLIRSFLQVFILQGLLLLIVAAPVIAVAGLPNTPDVFPWTVAGILLWVIGFSFEAVGDWQLRRFVTSKTSKNNIMDWGLWKFTRHPNYFGEVIQWWALWFICVASTVPASVRVATIIGPLSITGLILFVSGIPLLERKYAENKQYQLYAKKTSKFIPWDPKK